MVNNLEYIDSDVFPLYGKSQSISPSKVPDTTWKTGRVQETVSIQWQLRTPTSVEFRWSNQWGCKSPFRPETWEVGVLSEYSVDLSNPQKSERRDRLTVTAPVLGRNRFSWTRYKTTTVCLFQMKRVPVITRVHY